MAFPPAGCAAHVATLLTLSPVGHSLSAIKLYLSLSLSSSTCPESGQRYRDTAAGQRRQAGRPALDALRACCAVRWTWGSPSERCFTILPQHGHGQGDHPVHGAGSGVDGCFCPDIGERERGFVPVRSAWKPCVNTSMGSCCTPWQFLGQGTFYCPNLLARQESAMYCILQIVKVGRQLYEL